MSTRGPAPLSGRRSPGGGPILYGPGPRPYIIALGRRAQQLAHETIVYGVTSLRDRHAGDNDVTCASEACPLGGHVAPDRPYVRVTYYGGDRPQRDDFHHDCYRWEFIE